jgi:hypothetical protein
VCVSERDSVGRGDREIDRIERERARARAREKERARASERARETDRQTECLCVCERDVTLSQEAHCAIGSIQEGCQKSEKGNNS